MQVLAFFFIIAVVLCKALFIYYNDPYDLKEAPLQNYSDNLEYLQRVSSNIYAEIPVLNLLGRKDKRAPGFLEILRTAVERDLRVFVEAGTIRKASQNCTIDGCSTLIFGYFTFLTNRKLYSIDNSEENIYKARIVTENFKENIELIYADSVQFLKDFDKGLIDVLYLDTMDFDVMNPEVTQEFHLQEIKAAYNKLHKNSVVAIDHCEVINDCNCKLVREFLLDQGWKMTKSGYIQVFTHS